MTGEWPAAENVDYSLPADKQEAYEEACYLGDCAELRAAVIQKLQLHGAHREGEGWALFDISSGDAEEEGDVGVIGNRKEVLLRTDSPYFGPTVDGHLIPVVRILTKEIIHGIDGRSACLATDFSLSQNNNAQYNIDATGFEKKLNTGSLSALTFDIKNDELSFNRAVAETFTSAQTGLCLPDGRLLSDSTVNLQGLDESEVVSFVLFGNHKTRRDKLDALAFGHRILSEVVMAQPFIIKDIS